MSHSTTNPTSQPSVRLRPVALPTEHGGWSFLLEPIVLGLLASPTLAGLLIGLAALGAFLARHPLNLALGDRRRGRRYPRTVVAERFAAGYLLGALLAFAGALLLATAPFWPALLLAAPLALVQLVYDRRKQGRALPAELSGAAALAVTAPMIVLAGGWAPLPAAALWGVLAARALPAILYVRTRLRRAHGEEAPAWPTLIAHLVGLAAVGALAAIQLLPWTAALALVVLALRALYGLSPRRSVVPAKVIGFQEVGYGVLTIALIAIGFAIS